MIGMESVFLLSEFPCSRRIFYRQEVSEVFLPPIHGDVCKPASSISIPTDARNSASVVPIATGIPSVFLTGNFSQVTYAVIVAGPIDVVNFYGPVSVGIEPNHSMDEMNLLIDVDKEIAVRVIGSGFFASVVLIPSMDRPMRHLPWLPSDFPGFNVYLYELIQPISRHKRTAP